MKIFGQEGLGRPDQEIDATCRELKKYLGKNFDEVNIPVLQPVLLFFNEKVEIQALNAPVPTLQTAKLKDYIRRKSKENPLSQTLVEIIKAGLPQQE